MKIVNNIICNSIKIIGEDINKHTHFIHTVITMLSLNQDMLLMLVLMCLLNQYHQPLILQNGLKALKLC